MKYFKMLGVAALVSLAAMIAAGAGTASATVICKNNLSTTACSEKYPVGTEGTASLASGSTLTLESTGGTTLVTCTESVVKSTIKEAGSATTTVTSNLSSITFGGCTKEVKVISAGSAELHWISGTDNGTLTTINTQITVNGLFENESCIYGTGTGTDMGTTVGGNPGSLTINSLVKRQTGSGFLCPAETRLTGKYVATSPTNAWVAQA